MYGHVNIPDSSRGQEHEDPLRVALIALGGSISHAAECHASSPEAQGVSSSAILAFIEAADKDVHSLNSIMLLRHGHVIAEGWWAPYGPESPHSLYSLSKSFTSTAVDWPSRRQTQPRRPRAEVLSRRCTCRAEQQPQGNAGQRLAPHVTGHQTEPPRTADQAWTKTFLAHPVPFKPGTHFLYNTSATYMLSAIVQKVTGKTVLDYLRPRLFEPLGIENPTWETVRKAYRPAAMA